MKCPCRIRSWSKSWCRQRHRKTAQKWRQWITSTVSSIHRLIPILSITVWRLSMPLQRWTIHRKSAALYSSLENISAISQNIQIISLLPWKKNLNCCSVLLIFIKISEAAILRSVWTIPRNWKVWRYQLCCCSQSWKTASSTVCGEWTNCLLSACLQRGSGMNRENFQKWSCQWKIMGSEWMKRQ